MDPEFVRRFEPILIAWLAIVGACVGSFLNVAVFRLPRRCLSVLHPRRSFCPKCRRQLSWYENVPLLSWLVQRGKCRGCASSISFRYPLVEAVTMALFLWLALRIIAGGRMGDVQAWGLFLTHAVLGSALLVCTLTDLEFRIIPDEIDVPGILLAPVACLLVPAALATPPPDLVGASWWLEAHLGSALHWWGLDAVVDGLRHLKHLPGTDPTSYLHLSSFTGSVLGGAFGAAIIWSIGVIGSRLLGQDTMGFGDVKFMGMLGGFAGFTGVLLTFPVAFVAGSIGGIVHMAWSGHPWITGADLDEEELTPIRRLALAITGAKGPARPDERVPIRFGTGLFARLATGDPYIPFGPFLALGAFVVIYFPGLVPSVLRRLSGL